MSEDRTDPVEPTAGSSPPGDDAADGSGDEDAFEGDELFAQLWRSASEAPEVRPLGPEAEDDEPFADEHVSDAVPAEDEDGSADDWLAGLDWSGLDVDVDVHPLATDRGADGEDVSDPEAPGVGLDGRDDGDPRAETLDALTDLDAPDLEILPLHVEPEDEADMSEPPDDWASEVGFPDDDIDVAPLEPSGVDDDAVPGADGEPGPLKVLVIDDDAAIREMVELALSLFGMEVVTAPDGPQGLVAADEFRPDIIVVDVMMPGTDGYGVVEGLRQNDELCRIPVIMLTALASDTDQWRGWTAGVDSYVTKPLDPDVLAEEIERVVAL